MIHKKYNQHELAITVLVEHVVSVDRGVQYANKVNGPKVWSRLPKAWLDGLRIKDEICSDSKVDAPFSFAEVIEMANTAGKQDDLIRFLQMARQMLREPVIDTALPHAYAKTDPLHDMKEFLGMTNGTDVFEVGEESFYDELYQAAKLQF